MQIIREIQDNWKFILISIVIALFLISFNNAQASAANLNVKLSYREMIALGPDAEAKLMLVNPSENKSKFILSELNKELKNGVPVNFKLDLSEKEINSKQDYQLLAVIKWQRDMIWSESKRIRGSELLKKKDINIITKQKPGRLLSFKGKKDLKMRYLGGMAQVIIEDQEYILPQQQTASGAKFLNSKLSVWNKGRDLFLEKDNQSYQLSLISLAEINSKKAEFEIRGQEPYWEVKIDQDQLELKYDYLANKIIVPRANIKTSIKNKSLVYQVDTSFLDFEIKIIEDIHNDVMNGKTYPLTAFIKINGQKYIGGADLE